MNLLIVDDDERLRERLAKAFERRGFTVHTAADGEAAAAITLPIHFAVVDLRLPRENGLDVATALLAKHPDVKLVVLTAYGSIATAMEAVRRGALHYMQKPADADDILVAFARGADNKPTQTEVPSLARVEWEHINRVLDDCNGNISQAARLLRIERRSLQRKLAKFPVRE